MEKEKTKKKPVTKVDKKLSKKELMDKLFGKFKTFGDGLEYQRKMRHG